MDTVLAKSNQILQFISQLRQMGATLVEMSDLCVKFDAPPAPGLEKIESPVMVPAPELSPEELDALLYSETTKL